MALDWDDLFVSKSLGTGVMIICEASVIYSYKTNSYSIYLPFKTAPTKTSLSGLSISASF